MIKLKNKLGFLGSLLLLIALVACSSSNGIGNDEHAGEIGKDVDNGDSSDYTDNLIGPPVNTISTSEEKCFRMYRAYSGNGYLTELLDSEKAAEVNCCMRKINKNYEDFWNNGRNDIDAIKKISFDECFVSANGAEDNFTSSGENGVVNVSDSFEAWSYEKGNHFKTNHIGQLTGDRGLWMVWTDYYDGGSTYVNMGVNDRDPAFVSESMETLPINVIKECKGICGTVHFGEKGSLAGGRAPWAVQKVILVQDPDGEDVTEWRGFCVEYESKIPLRIALLTGHENDGADIFIHHILQPSKERKVVNLKWSDFEDVKTSKGTSVEEYVKKFMAVYVFEQADLGGEGFFNLTKLGVYGTCDK